MAFKSDFKVITPIIKFLEYKISKIASLGFYNFLNIKLVIEGTKYYFFPPFSDTVTYFKHIILKNDNEVIFKILFSINCIISVLTLKLFLNAISFVLRKHVFAVKNVQCDVLLIIIIYNI